MSRSDVPVLVLTVGERACAIPLPLVRETMRPLPIEPIAGTPPFVRGVSIIRGVATPVVDLKCLLDGPPSAAWGRFVTLSLGQRCVAIGVDAVAGVSQLDSDHLGDLPPMLQGVADGLIEAIATRDAQLLVVLRAARLVPEAVWKTLAAEATR